MGVPSKRPGSEKEENKEGLFLFTSPPSTPGERTPDITVRFQAVTSLRSNLAHQYLRVSSSTKLSQVRRSISKHFKPHFEKGFIFLCKNKEIPHRKERETTVFDILPKPPLGKPARCFQYPSVHYKEVSINYDGRRYKVTCACVVFLFEQSSISHWGKEALREELSGKAIPSFSFIPTDMTSWTGQLIEIRGTALHLYAACGKTKELQLTLEQLNLDRFVPEYLIDYRFASPLHYACDNGHLEVCETLVASLGKDLLYQRDMNGKTPLHCALYRRRYEVVAYILQQEPDLNHVDCHGNSCIDLLLAYDQKATNAVFETLQFDCLNSLLLLHFACHSMRKNDIVNSRRFSELLLPADAILELGRSIVHLAAMLGDKEVVDTLLDRGFEPDARDSSGHQPFHYACKLGHTDILAPLMTNGVDTEDVNEGIRQAVRSKHFKTAKGVHDVRPETQLERETMSLILHSLESHFSMTWTNLLPFLSCDANLLSKYLLYACHAGNLRAVRLAKDLGADVNFQDLMGRSALHEAVQMGHPQIAKFLLNAKANPIVTDWRGSTPIHYACAAGNRPALEVLCKYKGIQFQLQDSVGRTPLLVATHHKRDDIVAFLLENHGKQVGINCCDTYGQNILHYCVNLSEKTVELVLTAMKVAQKSEEGRISHSRTIGNYQSDRAKVRTWLIPNPCSEYEYEWDVEPSGYGRQKYYSYKDNKPFKYLRKIEYWKQTPSRERKPARFRRDVTFCKNCNLPCREKSHRCKNGDAEFYKKDMKPFQFHIRKGKIRGISDGRSPIHIAVVSGSSQLVNQLSRFLSNCMPSKDNLGRNVCDLAVDLFAAKQLSVILEVTAPEKALPLVARAVVGDASKHMQQSQNQMVEDLLKRGYSSEAKCNSSGQYDSLTPLEIAAKRNKKKLVDVLLNHGASTQCYALHYALLNGTDSVIHILLERIGKLVGKHKHDDDSHSEVREFFSRDSSLLTSACMSKRLSFDTTKKLIQLFPEMVTSDKLLRFKENELGFSELEIAKSIDPLCAILTSLKTKNANHSDKKEIEKIACHLIESKVHMGHVNADDYSDYHVSCKALFLAVEWKCWDVVRCLLNHAAGRFWECATSRKECNAPWEARFMSLRFSYTENNENKNENNAGLPNYLTCLNRAMAVIYMMLRRDVDENILKKFIQIGMHGILNWKKKKHFNDPAVSISNSSTVYEQNRKNYDAVGGLMMKMLMSVMFELSGYPCCWSGVVKLLRVAPALFQHVHFLIGGHGIPDARASLSELDRFVLSCVEGSWCRRNSYAMTEQKNLKRMFDDGFTLVHALAFYGDEEALKKILSSAIPVDINKKTEFGLTSLDIGAAQGNYAVVKELSSHGALIGNEALTACCMGENYQGLSDWSRILPRKKELPFTHEADRLKIFQLIMESGKNISVNFLHPEHGHPLLKTVEKGRWDLLGQLLQNWVDIQALFAKETRNITRIFFERCPDELCLKVLTAISEDVNELSPECLGQACLGASLRQSDKVLTRLLETIKSNRKDTWKCIVTETLEAGNKVCRKGENTDHGLTILHRLSFRRWLQCLKVIVDRLQGQHEGKMPHDQVTDCELLNIEDSSKATPLWYALTFQNWPVATFLLLRGGWTGRRAIPDLFKKKRFTLAEIYQKEPGKKKSFDKHINESQGFINCVLDQHYPTSLRKSVNGNDKHPTTLKKSHSVKEKRLPKGKATSDSSQWIKELKYAPDSAKTKVKRLYKIAEIAHHAGCAIIHIACATGNRTLMEECLQANPSALQLLDRNGLSPCVYAFANGDFNMIQMIKPKRMENETTAKCLENVILSKIISGDLSNKAKRVLHFINQGIYGSFKDMTDLSDGELEGLLNSSSFETTIENLIFYISKSGDTGSYVSEIIDFLKASKGVTTASNKLLPLMHRSSSHSNNTELLHSLLKEMNPEHFSPILLFGLAILEDSSVLSELVALSVANTHVQKRLESLLIAEYTFFDVLTLSLASSVGISDAAVENTTVLLERFAERGTLALHPNVLKIATDRGLWSVLALVVKCMLKKGEKVKTWWLDAVHTAVIKGKVQFIENALEVIDVSKLDEDTKLQFEAYSLLAAAFGQANVLECFISNDFKLKPRLKKAMKKDLLGRKYVDRQNWYILQYAANSNSTDCLAFVLEAFKSQQLNISVEDVIELLHITAKHGNIVMYDRLITFASTAGQGTPKEEEIQAIFLSAAENGHEQYCHHVMNTANFDLLFSPQNEPNVLHHCGRYGMKTLASRILDRKDNATVVLSAKDKFGCTPAGYARLNGKIQTMMLLSRDASSVHSFGPLEDTSEKFFTCGWFHYLMQENEGMVSTDKPVDLRPALPKERSLSLDNLLKSRDDNAADTFIFTSREMIPSILGTVRFDQLLGTAARYGCSHSMKLLLEEGSMKMDLPKSILRVGGSLVKAIAYRQYECVKTLMTYIRPEDVEAGQHALTDIFHHAVLCGSDEIVSLVIKKFGNEMKNTKNRYGFTPLTVSASLGHHSILRLLCSEDSLTSQDHTGHAEVMPDCVECLLDCCIGWQKVYQEHYVSNGEQTVKSIRGTDPALALERGMCSFTSFTKKNTKRSSKSWFQNCWFEQVLCRMKTHKLDELLQWSRGCSDALIKAGLHAMGYSGNTADAVKFLYLRTEKMANVTRAIKRGQTEATIKCIEALASKGFGENEFVQMATVAASCGNRTLLEHLKPYWTARPNVSSRSSAGESLSEIAYAFGHLSTGHYIDKEMDSHGITPSHQILSDLKEIIPPTVLWTTGLSVPGDQMWLKSVSQPDSPMSFADVWITTNLGKEIRDYIESNTIKESLIPGTIREKRLLVDVASFKKQKTLPKSEMWIQSLISSTLIFGRVVDLLDVGDHRMQSSTGVHIKCLNESYGEQAQTMIEVDGSVSEAVVIRSIDDVTVVGHDETPVRRMRENQIRSGVQNVTVPDMESKLISLLGRKVKLIIDWRSVDSKRQTGGLYERVLRTLSGEEFRGSALGGLEDVVAQCQDMVDFVEKNYNTDTANYMLGYLNNLKEINVKYVESLPESNSNTLEWTEMSPTWSFTLENNALRYDRSSFPLLKVVHLCHSLCVMLLPAVTKLICGNKCKDCSDPLIFKAHAFAPEGSKSQEELEAEYALQTRRPSMTPSQTSVPVGSEKTKTNTKREMGLKLDLRSFSKVQTIAAFKDMFIHGVVPEVDLLAHHYNALLRFNPQIRKVVISNSTGKERMPLTLEKGILTVQLATFLSDCAWKVEPFDSRKRLKEMEERNLSQRWPASVVDKARSTAENTAGLVKDVIGLEVTINIDEQRIVGLCLEKYDREMTSPFQLAPQSAQNAVERLQYYFTDTFFSGKSSIFSFCRYWKSMNLPPGLWYAVDAQLLNQDKIQGKVLALYPKKGPRGRADFVFKVLDGDEIQSLNVEDTAGVWIYRPFGQHSSSAFGLKAERLQLISMCVPFSETENRSSEKHLFESRLYRVVDGRAILQFVEAFPGKKRVGHELSTHSFGLGHPGFDAGFDPIECVSNVFLPYAAVTDVRTTATNELKGSNTMAFNTIFNWSSLPGKDKNDSSSFIDVVMRNFQDTMQELELKMSLRDCTLCSISKKVSELFTRKKRSLLNVFVGCLSEEAVREIAPLRSVVGSKKRSILGKTVKEYDVHILSQREMYVNVEPICEYFTFTNSLEESFVQLLELELEGCFPFAIRKILPACKDASDKKPVLDTVQASKESSMGNKAKRSTKPVRVDLQTALLAFQPFLDILKSLSEQGCLEKSEVRQVLLAKSRNGTSVQVEDFTLTIKIDRQDLSVETCRTMLCKTFSIPSTCVRREGKFSVNVLVEDPGFYFPVQGNNKFYCSIRDAQGKQVMKEVLQVMLKTDGFSVQTSDDGKDFQKRSVASNVYFDEDRLDVNWTMDNTIPFGLPIRFELFGKSVGYLSPITLKEGKVWYSGARWEGETKSVRINSGGTFYFYVLHDEFCLVAAKYKPSVKTTVSSSGLQYQPLTIDTGNAEGECRVTFQIFEDPPRLPGLGRKVPHVIQQETSDYYSWTSSNRKYNRKHLNSGYLFSYKCLDPCRKVRFQAVCDRCHNYLRILTPFCFLTPRDVLKIYPSTVEIS